MPEQGEPQVPPKGAPRTRTPGTGATSKGATGKGATGTGASGRGASGRGATGTGASGAGATGKGATRKGAGTGRDPGATGASRNAPARTSTAKNLPATREPAAADERGGAIAEFLAPVAGFGVTMSTLFKPVVTEQYPFEKVPTLPRYHGRHQLNRYADGLEKCIGCELCAWACPADAIYVEAGNNTPEAQYSPGERYGKVYQINYLRCIFCGLCIEACPTRALTMTNEYELASTTREEMIFEKDQLLAPLRSGMLSAPHPMAAGTDDDDYYRNEVTGPSQDQVAWVREHRPDEESLESAEAAARTVQAAGGAR